MLNPATQSVLWEKNIKADQSNVFWWGATGEYEKVISEALTKALNQAANEFTAADFAKNIKK
jgi:hypothetical protein